MEQLVRQPKKREEGLESLPFVQTTARLSLELASAQVSVQLLAGGIPAPLKEGAAGQAQLAKLLKAGQSGAGALSIVSGNSRYSLLGSEIQSAKLEGGRLELALAQPIHQIAWDDYHKLLMSADARKEQVHDAVRTGKLSVV